MKIKILCIDKTKEAWIQEGEQEFIKRISKWAKIEFVIIESKIKGDVHKIKQEEGKKILSHFKPDEHPILLELTGKTVNSEEFSSLVQNTKDSGKKLCFIIGGAYGVSEEVKQNTLLHIQFSQLTFTHQMIRLILLEQIYRAFSILAGSEYHK